MPATIVHAYFGNDVYDILPKTLKNKVNLSRIKTFGQSTDSLMFYNLFSVMPGKKMRKFQKYFHDNDTQAFFINLINYIKDRNYELHGNVYSEYKDKNKAYKLIRRQLEKEKI